MIYTLLIIVDSEIVSKTFARKAINKQSSDIINNIVYLLYNLYIMGLIRSDYTTKQK